MDEKALLDAIRLVVREELGGFQEEVRKEFKSIKTELAAVEEIVAETKERIIRMEILHENVIITRLKAMREGIGNVKERFNRLEYVEIKQRDDDIRISGLEKIIIFDREHAKAVAASLTGE
jgi:hypothetical protein